MSRYIKKSIKEVVDEESCFKCAWCGTPLFERHHITPYAQGGQNSTDNLILLCPNCHTSAHNGEISEKEISKRKKELNDSIDKNSGCLSITDNPSFVLGGTTYKGEVERILVHNDYDYIKIERLENNLLISLKIFDKEGKLICWMSKNRWWLENKDILDFTFQKNLFCIQSNKIGTLLHLEIKENIIQVKCKMYVNNRLIEFDEYQANIGNSTFKIGTITANKKSIVFNV